MKKYPGVPYLEAFKNALKNNITYPVGGDIVPVYTHPIIEDYQKPYILLHEISVSDDPQGTDRDSYCHDCTITMEVHTWFEDAAKGSQKPMMEITDQIINLVGEGLSISADFYDPIPSVDAIIPLRTPSDGGVIMRNIIRFRNRIKQN